MLIVAIYDLLYFLTYCRMKHLLESVIPSALFDCTDTMQKKDLTETCVGYKQRENSHNILYAMTMTTNAKLRK